MSSLVRSLIAGTVLVCAAMAAQAREETKIAPKDLPKAVAEAVKKRFPDAAVTSAEKEVDKGKTSYEVKLKSKDQALEVVLTAEGEITAIEKQVDPKELPKPVTEAVNMKFPKATFKTAEEVTKVKEGKEALDSYEVGIVTTDKKEYEVAVSPEGKIIKATEKKKRPTGTKVDD
jgi:uncharacterized membrane protein YkoI